MKCRTCGSQLEPTTTDLPFKVTERTIVIVKQIPVAQCPRCSEYLIEDSVFARVEELLSRADPSAELEIIRFAA
ncbi:MAG TPA: YgiT-type zinc finger protein [Vicinamibacteria bacterium]|nr:YgiT-type zinc finger protein [Vicinamibacteria bacterium]